MCFHKLTNPLFMILPYPISIVVTSDRVVKRIVKKVYGTVFQSWEALPPDTATFTPDITPLILAAHRDNYEIIKILLDRGATLPMPHDVR